MDGLNCIYLHVFTHFFTLFIDFYDILLIFHPKKLENSIKSPQKIEKISKITNTPKHPKQVFSGSADEQEHQQGIAHLTEHVAYMGSKKRERLFGTGSQTNAYTDFHHTVFYAACPVVVPGVRFLVLFVIFLGFLEAF